jgi:hypothetical protein
VEWEDNRLTLGDCPSLFDVDKNGMVFYEEGYDNMGNPSRRDFNWSMTFYTGPTPSYNTSSSRFKTRDCDLEDVRYTVHLLYFQYLTERSLIKKVLRIGQRVKSKFIWRIVDIYISVEEDAVLRQ